jgi:glutathione synthase
MDGMLCTMSLRVALQADPLESLNYAGDSTYALALEAQRRGYALFHYAPQALSLSGGLLTARGRAVAFHSEAPFYSAGAEEVADLSDFDVVLLRQDPPFHMGYVTTTHLLEHVHPATLVVNAPAGVRDSPEKILVLHYPDLMPPTIVTRDMAAVRAFQAEHGDIILKPLYGNGGAQVFKVPADGANLGALTDMFLMTYAEPFMVQRYLPAVLEGDKRIILIEGEPAGAVLRVPQQGEVRANLHVGGRGVACAITDRDREICAAIGPELRRRGQVFVGIDVIGGYLTEINVVSPTGLVDIAALGGRDLTGPLWDAIEARYAATR